MNNYQLSIIHYPLQEDSKLSIINSQLNNDFQLNKHSTLTPIGWYLSKYKV